LAFVQIGFFSYLKIKINEKTACRKLKGNEKKTYKLGGKILVKKSKFSSTIEFVIKNRNFQ